MIGRPHVLKACMFLAVGLLITVPGAIARTSTIAASPANPDAVLQGKRICYTVNLGDPYSTALVTLMKHEASFYGFKLDVFDIHNDIATQINELEDCVTKHYAAIVLHPYDPNALVPVVKKAYDAHIPMVNIEQEIGPAGRPYVTSFITDNGFLEGQGAAKLIIQATNGHGNVAMIDGLPNNPVTPLRTNGFKSYIKAHAPGLKVIAEGTGAWDTAKSQTLMENFLTAHNNITAVYAEDSGMAFGAVNALAAHGLTKKIPVVSINGNKQEYDDIRAGKLYGTVLNDASFVAVNAIQRIRDILEHRPVMTQYIMPATTISKKNVNDFVAWW